MPKNKILPPLLWMLLIFAVSSIPMDVSVSADRGMETLAFLTNLNPNIQNLLHIPLYGALCFLWLRYFKAADVDRRQGMIYGFFITALYGGIDEVHQSFVPGRYGSLVDIYLNVLGAFLAIFICFWFAKARV